MGVLQNSENISEHVWRAPQPRKCLRCKKGWWEYQQDAVAPRHLCLQCWYELAFGRDGVYVIGLDEMQGKLMGVMQTCNAPPRHPPVE